jgi:hypothetical protein
MATSTVSRSFTLQVVLARVVMIATGVWMAYIGYAMLTTPLAIPLTVGVWLVAAATVALGARGKIERGWGGFDANDRE